MLAESAVTFIGGKRFPPSWAIESALVGIGQLGAELLCTSYLSLLNLPAEILATLREGKGEFEMPIDQAAIGLIVSKN